MFWLKKVDISVHNLDHQHVSRFLNRILGLPSVWQRKLFDLFASTLDSLIRQAKREMSYDQGIMEIRGSHIEVLADFPRPVWGHHNPHVNPTDLIKQEAGVVVDVSNVAAPVDVGGEVLHYILKVDRYAHEIAPRNNLNNCNERIVLVTCLCMMQLPYLFLDSNSYRGCKWEEALALLEQAAADKPSSANSSFHSKSSSSSNSSNVWLNGFHVTRNAYQGMHFVALVIEKTSRFASNRPTNVLIVRPVTGRNEMNRMVSERKRKYYKHTICCF